MFQHRMLNKLGYGFCSVCAVSYGTTCDKKKGISKWKIPLSLSNVAHCEIVKGCSPCGPSKYKLLDVHVFFRHGARTPLQHIGGIGEVTYDYKKWGGVQEHTDVPYRVETPDGRPRPDSRLDTHYSKTIFKGGMLAGSLTTVGRQQAYELGKRLRQRYIQDLKFVKDGFDTKQVTIRSTNIERSIQSLRSVLAGMYGKESFKEEVAIPVVHLDAEVLYPNFRFCDTLRQLKRNAPDYLMEQNGFKFVSHYIRYFTKQSDDVYVEMMYWRDHIVARKTHGLEVPQWLEAIEDQVQMWATKSLEIYMCGVPQDRILVLQLAVGPMLNMVVHGFKEAIKNSKSGPRLHLYSGHDSTLMPLLVSLGIFDHKWPPFTADLTLELYTTPEKDIYVKISYNNEDVTFPGYDTPMIPYSEFLEIVNPYLVTPSQYMKRCHDIDLAREHAKRWEAVVQSHEQEEKDEETFKFPPNM